MAGTKPQVRIGGTWLSSLGWYGELNIEHRWPFGCWETSWTMNLPTYQRPSALIPGALVEVFVGPGVIWSGLLAEPNWDTQEFVATGLARQAEQALCLTSAGVSTSIPNTAVDQAIARGALNWIRSASLSTTAFADVDQTDGLNFVGALLDSWTTEQNKRWAVPADRRVYAAADPTTPTWYVAPGAGILGVAAEEYVTDVYGRYRTATGAYATAHASDTTQGVGTFERGVDLTKLGRITAVKATAVCTGILNKAKARTGWTNGVEVSAAQITTPGGIPAHLSLVVAGQMVRMQGLQDQRGLAAYTDVVLGETVWNVDDGTITLNPVGLADRDLSKIVEAAGGELL